MSKKRGFLICFCVCLLVAIVLFVGFSGSISEAQEPEGEPTVTVNAGEDQTAEPGASVTLTAAVDAADGSDVTGAQWEQTSGVPLEVSGAESDTLTVTLADAGLYKEALLASLRTVDRFGVQAIDPHSLEASEIAVFEVTVTTSSGTYSDDVEVIAELPYAVSLGINNVPVNVPVLFRGKVQDAYDWELAPPDGSTATLNDASSQYPSLTPDVKGQYTLTEATSGATFDVFAGTWVGVITGQDEDGEPISDETCLSCHNDTIAPDKFTAWKSSGHAEIVTQNIDNPDGHWSLGCASCHSVGYAPGVDNGGFDEAIAEEGWEAPHGAVGNWAQMLEEYPASARMANIQCENCHGPQDSDAHIRVAVRQNISSELCGSCHGEPLRHGRYQQWEESKHSNLELAIEEATVEGREESAAHCGRCHSGQGFLAWIAQGDLTKRIQGADGDATVEELAALGLTVDTVETTTCTVCHDPHGQGKGSGEPNTATVRITDNTPMLPAGFQAIGVGRGAICMTCHNSRNGAHNDVDTPEVDDRAPHYSTQADVLMGENAYFVPVGQRSQHAFIADTCTTCHNVLTPPPEDLSYQGSGTNHTFEADKAICTECHGAFDGGTMYAVVETGLEELKAAIEQALIAEISAQTSAGNTVTLIGMGEDEADVDITAGSMVSAVELAHSHGRIAMNITIGSKAIEHARIGSDTMIKDADGNEVGTLVDSPAGQLIAKASWNYLLLHDDGSLGAHNPSFVMDVVGASMDALK